MSRIVKDDGSPRSRLVLIGEMPAQAEEAIGKPFVGPSGQLLLKWWRDVGLSRSDFYITNVVPYRHNPKNAVNLVPRDELHDHTEALHDRIAALEDPVVIVPTGNTALRALVGKSGITKHRGSIYRYCDRRGREIKVIPTIHPAALFKQPGWERRCISDWTRITGDSDFRELRRPEREHYIRPSFSDLVGYLEDAQARAEILALDIETPRKLKVEQVPTRAGKTRTKRSFGDRRITCVGFSFESHFSFTIPTTLEYWQDEETLEAVWQIIRQLCALPCPKALQNGLFDTWWLAQSEYTVPVTKYLYDTRWLSHAADPLDSHDLGYQASIHTREPYWKDDTKGDSKDDAEILDLDTFWRYNGKDAAVTRELVDVHLSRLGPRVDWYKRTYQTLFAPLLRMSLVGTRMDDKRRRSKAAQYLAESIAIQDKLTALAGVPLYGEKGSLSFKKLQDYLYGKLGLPARRNRATGGVTTNEVAVRQLMLRHPLKLGKDGEVDKPGPLILAHRRLEALRRFVKEGITDSDGRVRSQFGWVDTLRLRSGKNPKGTGANSQNTDRELLDLYVPDPGCIFLEVDLSQAEDRVVKMKAAGLTNDPRRREILLARARAMPWENDEHRRAATIIFYHDLKIVNELVSLGDPRVTKGERYLGKRGRHAGNYGMRGKTLSEQLLKEGVVITPDEGDRMINTLMQNDTPEIRDWQRDVRQRVLRDKAIVTSWGLVWDFTYERLNDDLFRRAYAVEPQSDVVMLMNQWGFLPVDKYIRERRFPATIQNQRHDSLVISTPPEHAFELACFLKVSLERPRVYANESLVIPCEFKLGRHAAGEHEFKRFPSKRQFDEVAFGLAETVKAKAA